MFLFVVINKRQCWIMNSADKYRNLKFLLEFLSSVFTRSLITKRKS